MDISVLTHSLPTAMAIHVRDAVGVLLSDLLTCEVCRNVFDSTSRLPRILPCHHSFCGECLQTLTTHGKVKCPKCRQEAAVTTKPFQTDALKVTLMDWKQLVLGVEDKACQGCSEVARATWTCRECDEFYCNDCATYHCLEENHVLDSLPEAAKSLEKLLQTPSEKCLKHPDQILDLFCLTCNMALCSTCAQFAHQRGHQLVELAQALKGMKKEVAPSHGVQHWRKHISISLACRVLKASADLKKKLTTCVAAAAAAAVHQEITERMEELRAMVRSLVVIVCQAAAVPSDLGDLPVAFPEIRLDGSPCHEDCTVSGDGCTITNSFNPSRSSQSQQKFRFRGTCGTAALPAQTCYWEVHVNVSTHPQFASLPFCEVGVASTEALQSNGELGAVPGSFLRHDSVFTVALTPAEGSVMAIGQNNYGTILNRTAITPFNPHNPVERTLGFLLDVQKQCLVTLDVDGGQVLCEGKVDMSQPLWPCASLIWSARLTHASVCVRVVSGCQLTLTPDMVSLIRSLLK